ncbi:AsnC family transcriptional regulator [Dictyobacter sp. S3.2.2.5]|uniref:AsnC family transcriptional regulator n=1 Tax=Dictyobacter halimunensis TaxID=3026934 RepID=A0ABQ6G7Q7_9CHLR|nr:AsnC family transcriptional regulator [Dictyobacter sp. S3.2.2.5]
MDAIDRKIVSLLRDNGRLSQETLAQRVHLSRPAVHERVKRLEEQGVLRGYQALVDWEALGLPITAFIWVRTSGTQCHEVGQILMRLGNQESMVEECHRVTGEWCMLLKVRVALPLALQELIDRMRAVPDVQATMTTLALSTLSARELGDEEVLG